MIKEATGEDDTERSSMIDSDIDEVEGWAFEYKLQDYSTIKHLSAQFVDNFHPMLEHYSFFEDHFGT